MSGFAYICPNCGKAVSYPNDERRYCKYCEGRTVPLGIEVEQWKALDENGKKEAAYNAFVNAGASGQYRNEVAAYVNVIREARRKKLAELTSQVMISSGYNFEGYKITKYSGYISGDDAVQIPRSGVFGGKNGSNLTNALVKIRIQALKELKEAAVALGCNAVIGVDFDYITLEPETANIGGGTLYEPYVICVTANGTAVVIEKE